MGCLTGISLLVLLFVVGVVAAYLLRAHLISMKSEQLNPPPVTHGLEAGYDWRLAPIDGEPQDFAQWRGRPVFLHLWSPRCMACLAEIGSIQRLADKMADTDIAFVMLTMAYPDNAPAIAAEYGLTLPLYKKAGPLPTLFNTESVPVTFVIAPSGAVAFMHRGAARWDDERVVTWLTRQWGAAETEGASQEGRASPRAE
ncbi:MAG: TlpA family protein disulfide reductase [Candidatus Hydrogenedentota bacterium]